MNKEYTFMEGQVVVSDEIGHQTKREYFDKLPQVLIQENVIEVMEYNIEELVRRYQGKQNETGKFYIPTATLALLGVVLVWPYLLDVTNSFLGFYHDHREIINGRLGELTLGTYERIPFSICAPITIIIDSFNYFRYKWRHQESQGIDFQIEYLKAQLEIERATLEELQRIKTREKEYPIYATFKVDDEEALEHIRRQLALYKDLGYNLKRYYKYFKRDELDVRLMGRYTTSEIKEAQDFLEEKGPSLVYKNKKQEDTKKTSLS